MEYRCKGHPRAGVLVNFGGKKKKKTQTVGWQLIETLTRDVVKFVRFQDPSVALWEMIDGR